jgi:hypothetical protein
MLAANSCLLSFIQADTLVLDRVGQSLFDMREPGLIFNK